MRRSLPHLELTPRARADLEDCLRFIRQFPRGKANERKQDIVHGLRAIRDAPLFHRVQARRPLTGIELRRRPAAQFAIIYAVFEPDSLYPAGIVSIRAIRHRRTRNVFVGVQEPGAQGSRGLILD